MIIKNNFKYYVEQLLLTLIPILIFNIGLPHLLPILKVVGSTVFLLILVIAMAALATGKRGFIQVIRLISIVNFLVVLAMFLTFYISSFLVLTDAIGFENFLGYFSKIITSFSLAYSIELASALSLTASQLMVFVSAAALLLFGIGMLIKKVLNKNG
ncbi:hypothetical protein [Rossellomorea sp. NRS-1567]|uniref:hypothetical protein n=1 Tax=Rossellomorea sp. NRS-1567 TaxID=3233901 RepID=UPI003D2E37D8